MNITIDEEFKSLIPPLSNEERMQLMDNLQREGCRDPLVVWKGTGILIDGHNRFEICERENIDYSVHEIGFESREKALDWIYCNQLGRRNLSPADASELRGRMYNGRKKKHGGERKASPQNDDLKTAEKVAKETGVSKATIERDGKYAEAVEAAAKQDPEIRAKVRSGKVKKSEVLAASKTKQAKSAPAKAGKTAATALKPKPDSMRSESKAAEIVRLYADNATRTDQVINGIRKAFAIVEQNTADMTELVQLALTMLTEEEITDVFLICKGTHEKFQVPIKNPTRGN